MVVEYEPRPSQSRVRPGDERGINRRVLYDDRMWAVPREVPEREQGTDEIARRNKSTRAQRIDTTVYAAELLGEVLCSSRRWSPGQE